MRDSSVRLSKEVIAELWKIAGKLQQKRRKKVTISQTIQFLIDLAYEHEFGWE